MSNATNWLFGFRPASEEPEETAPSSITGSEHERQVEKLRRSLKAEEWGRAKSVAGSMREAQPVVSKRIDAGSTGGRNKRGYRSPLVQLLASIVKAWPDIALQDLKKRLEERAPHVEDEADPAVTVWNLDCDDQAEKVYWRQRDGKGRVSDKEQKYSSLAVLLSRIKQGT